MKYINSYRIFEAEIHSLDGFQREFGISREEINDLLVEISDDFYDIKYWVGNPSDSWLVLGDPSLPYSNIFVIYFESTKPNWEKENLYDLEHFLMKGKLKQLKSYFKEYGLEIYCADFGEIDTQYEIVVCKKGTNVIETQMYKDRYRGRRGKRGKG